jgi:hypothetical protein
MLTGRIDWFKDAFKIGAFRFVSKPIEWEDKRYEINGYLLPEVIVDFGDKYYDKS